MGNRQSTNRLDQRTIDMQTCDKYLLGGMLVAFLIGAVAMWGVDYHNYHSTVTELLTKCGEPCL